MAVSVKDFGAVGDGVTDDTVAISIWLDALIANDIEGHLPDGVFLCDSLTKAAANGIRISGTGTIKATGTARTNMIKFTGVRGEVNINGPTFDANNIVARGLEILSTGHTDATTLGSIYLGPDTKVINAFNAIGNSRVVIGVYIQGGFSEVVSECTIDGCDSQDTSGAEAYGLLVTWSSSMPDDWVRVCTLTSNSKIRNVKNSNTVLENADGIQFLAPVSQVANFTVVSGALFEECKGRAIKSQVLGNAIDSPTIRRTLYDGLTEIDMQYSGGHCLGANVFHDGVRVDAVIGVTQRLSPNYSHCDVGSNTLIITGSPASDTANMVQVFGTDNTDSITNQGVTLHHNKVFGTVEHFATVYGTNVADVNIVVDESNWVKTIATSWLNMARVFANRAQLSYIARNNVCEDGCTGSTIVSSGDLKVIEDTNNMNITPFLSTPFVYTATSGVVVPKGEKVIRVNGEGNTTDDIDTITMTNYSPNEHLTIYNSGTSYTRTYKDGTGNLKLNGDCALASANDTLVVRFDGTNACEVSRSING